MNLHTGDPVPQPREQPSHRLHLLVRQTPLAYRHHLDLAGHAGVDDFWYPRWIVAPRIR